MTAESWGWLVLIGAVWGVGYFLACWWWPFANCTKCKGRGQFRSPSKKYWRPCRKCKGSGTKIRTGRRVWNFLSGTARKAS